MKWRSAQHYAHWCLLAAVGLLAARARGAEPRAVTEEFRAALARISSSPVKTPDAISFPGREARFVRVAIHATSGNSQPGIDELEIFGPEGKENLALAARGAVASASSVIAGYAIHQVKHLNDGLYGNSHSWIAATTGQAWVQIELPKTATVASVVITRDREGKYHDRLPEVVDVLVSADGKQWQTVAERQRTGASHARRLPRFALDRLPEKSWDGFVQYAFLRERAT